MREIKFRFWLEKEKKMCSWELMKKECDRLSIFEMKGFIPLQYTGLKDKNGKEIYEGDIISGKSHKKGGFFICDVIGVVSYGGMAFSFQGKKLGVDISSKEGSEWFYTITNPKMFKDVGVEVIGNIYESPELLGEAGVEREEGE